MKSGVEHIADERQHQIDRYLFTGEHHADHPEWYEDGQLRQAARVLLCRTTDEYDMKNPPHGWDLHWWQRLCAKPHLERLKISGALLAAEIDRLQVIESRKPQ